MDHALLMVLQKNNYDNSLLLRIKYGLRKIGCVKFVDLNNTTIVVDVNFTLQRSLFGHDINVYIPKNDLPIDFDLMDFDLRMPAFQKEVCMSIIGCFDNNKDIVIVLHQGYLFDL
jgi:hypothetical protein